MVKGPYTSKQIHRVAHNSQSTYNTLHNLQTSTQTQTHTAEVGKTASQGLVTIELPIAELLLIQQTNIYR